MRGTYTSSILPLTLSARLLTLALASPLASGCTCGGARGGLPQASRDFGDFAAPPPDAVQAASSTYALFEAYEELRTPAYLRRVCC
jgi:hypothetical protein